jgi:hypothetical protein
MASLTKTVVVNGENTVNIERTNVQKVNVELTTLFKVVIRTLQPKPLLTDLVSRLKQEVCILHCTYYNHVIFDLVEIIVLS